jgi:hypothetical protein
MFFEILQRKITKTRSARAQDRSSWVGHDDRLELVSGKLRTCVVTLTAEVDSAMKPRSRLVL